MDRLKAGTRRAMAADAESGEICFKLHDSFV